MKFLEGIIKFVFNRRPAFFSMFRKNATMRKAAAGLAANTAASVAKKKAKFSLLNGGIFSFLTKHNVLYGGSWLLLYESVFAIILPDPDKIEEVSMKIEKTIKQISTNANGEMSMNTTSTTEERTVLEEWWEVDESDSYVFAIAAGIIHWCPWSRLSTAGIYSFRGITALLVAVKTVGRVLKMPTITQFNAYITKLGALSGKTRAAFSAAFRKKYFRFSDLKTEKAFNMLLDKLDFIFLNKSKLKYLENVPNSVIYGSFLTLASGWYLTLASAKPSNSEYIEHKSLENTYINDADAKRQSEMKVEQDNDAYRFFYNSTISSYDIRDMSNMQQMSLKVAENYLIQCSMLGKRILAYEYTSNIDEKYLYGDILHIITNALMSLRRNQHSMVLVDVDQVNTLIDVLEKGGTESRVFFLVLFGNSYMNSTLESNICAGLDNYIRKVMHFPIEDLFTAIGGNTRDYEKMKVMYADAEISYNANVSDIQSPLSLYMETVLEGTKFYTVAERPENYGTADLPPTDIKGLTLPKVDRKPIRGPIEDPSKPSVMHNSMTSVLQGAHV